MNKTKILSLLSAIIFAILVVLIILILLGKNPFDFLVVLFTAFFHDENGNMISNFFQQISPLIFAAIGVAFAFKTGLFNIGAEGQVTLGILGALVVGYIPNIPVFIHLPLVLLSGFIFGAFWGFIPGVLKAYFKVHEVVITIMLNYIALYLVKDTFFPIFGNPATTNRETLALADSLTFKNLAGLKILRIPVNFWIYFLFALLAVGVFYFIIYKTKFGYEIRAGGLNSDAADYAGIKSKKNMMLAMMISGGFAGIGGAVYLLMIGTIATNGFELTNIGFDGLAASLLGSSTPIGVLFGSTILTYLNVISLEIQQVLIVPKEITSMIVALILFFIAMSYMFEKFWDKRLQKSEKKQPKNRKEDVV
ncbi:ABC transporter permease [Erysipelotrichaceae bacterium]|nr:ABC transporter permease [Erysipelotrichaceae bacterium]